MGATILFGAVPADATMSARVDVHARTVSMPSQGGLPAQQQPQRRSSTRMMPSAAQLRSVSEISDRLKSPNFRLNRQKDLETDFLLGIALGLGIGCERVQVISLGIVAEHCNGLPSMLRDTTLLAHQSGIEDQFEPFGEALERRIGGIDASQAQFREGISAIGADVAAERLMKREERDGTLAAPEGLLLPATVYAGFRTLAGLYHIAARRMHADADKLGTLMRLCSKGAVIGGVLKVDRVLPIFTR